MLWLRRNVSNFCMKFKRNARITMFRFFIQNLFILFYSVDDVLIISILFNFSFQFNTNGGLSVRRRTRRTKEWRNSWMWKRKNKILRNIFIRLFHRFFIFVELKKWTCFINLSIFQKNNLVKRLGRLFFFFFFGSIRVEDKLQRKQWNWVTVSGFYLSILILIKFDFMVFSVLSSTF